MKILIVEDDSKLLTQLTDRLRSEAYAVDQASNGEDGLHLLQESPIDLAIVDLGLPDFSGIELIKNARKKGSMVPVLILTARSNWQEKVEGLEAGADDYMVKPFEIEELLARIRVLLRRKGGWAQSILTCGPITMEPSTHTVTKKGKKIELTSYEFKVLEYLMTHAGEVISKTTLSDHIYEEDLDRDSNVMEVFIRRLRKKLDEDGKLNPIETIRGEGYKFTLKREG
ncbi:MAG: response regulator transcription factor [Bdellovibrionota bacterium]